MPYSVQNIRNVCLLGHSGTGKTSLVESLLYMTGASVRQGNPADGNTVSDFDPEEIKRQEQLRRHRIKSRERYQKIKAGEHAVGQPFQLICKCCGEEFESKRSNTLFCSPKCRTKFYRQEAAENRKRECVCENCGKTFTATRRDVKYCCDDCRTEANRRMQKERNVAKQIKKNEPVLLDAPPIKENGQKQKTA